MPGFANGICCLSPSLLVSVAFCLSLTSSSLCNYLNLDYDFSSPKFGKPPKAIGFWCYESMSGDRYEYLFDPAEDDNAFASARALGLTANVVGFVVWLTYLFAACIPFPPTVMLCCGFLCFMACMFEGFKFWMFKSDICEFSYMGNELSCSLGPGGKCGISSTVFWFVAALATCAHGKERMDVQKRDGGGDRQPEEQAVVEEDKN